MKNLNNSTTMSPSDHAKLHGQDMLRKINPHPPHSIEWKEFFSRLDGKSNLKFCYNKTLRLGRIATRAVAMKSKYWQKGSILKIAFIGGGYEQIRIMKDVIEELLSPLNLSLEYVDSSISDIRIGFKYGYGSWSYLGTDCRFISKTEQTLNIGWDGKDVMYHEFCHALNLSHEHQNPKGGIVWNEEQVIQDLSGPPNNWSIAQIRHNVLDKLDPLRVDSTEFDEDSVMLYYFPTTWTIGDFKTNNNLMPSITDKEFLIKAYVDDKVSPVISLMGESKIVLDKGEYYIEQGATALDNSDGDITDNIVIEGNVDTNIVGLQYVVYSVSDKAGNKSEAIRAIQVRELSEVEELLIKLFPSAKRLSYITEDQLVIIASEIGLKASKKALKADTIERIWEEFKKMI